MSDEMLDRLRGGRPVVWTNQARPESHAFNVVDAGRHLVAAEVVWSRFAPALAGLFDTPGGEGRVFSPLLRYPRTIEDSTVLVKADHALPISACVKARGGVFGLLRVIERIAVEAGLIIGHSSYESLVSDAARAVFGEHTVTVASTGNLGFSIGVVAAAFGLKSEVHMSACAQEWKKERLRRAGSSVVEHEGDYTSTVHTARTRAGDQGNIHFIDDENSWDLFVGYAGAAKELAGQLDTLGVQVSVERPLVVYLPCGVGGAPGGITYGLRTLFGDAVVCVLAEPTEAACMLLALASGDRTPPATYDFGLNTQTVADGLAVSRASPLVLDKVRTEIDAIVAVPDEDLLDWVRRAWAEAELKLEPSAAAGFAAFRELRRQWPDIQQSTPGDRAAMKHLDRGCHVIWTTGGDLMPEKLFQDLQQQ